MASEQELTQAFHCTKCRGTRCAARHVAFPGFIPFSVQRRYLALTCALCGHTEFYDQEVIESVKEPLESRQVALEPEG